MPKLKYGNGSISPRRIKRKDGTERRFYHGRIYNNEGKQISVYGRTQKECIDKLKNLREILRAELDARRASTSQQSKGPIKLYSDWLDEWVKEFKNGKLEEDYFVDFTRNVEKVRQALGAKPLKEIKALEIQKYLNTLPRCNTTVKLYDIINGSLQKAEDFEVIKHNPCKAVERPNYEEQKRRAFQIDEQAAIFAELNERYAQLFFFLCCTGLRIGEFLALRSEDVDFSRRIIKVQVGHSLRSGKTKKTKTETSVRKVYFDEMLFEVFPLSGFGDYTYNGVKKAFIKTYKKLNIAGPDISVTHSCRHTYASMMYAIKMPDKFIQQQMGHASLSTTMDIYTDIMLQGDSAVYDYFKRLKSTLKSTLILN